MNFPRTVVRLRGSDVMRGSRLYGNDGSRL